MTLYPIPVERETATNTYPFLAGGGEMGERTRNYNWSATALGAPDQWPLSLRTTVGIVLHSAFPMFLFWGPDLLCFYNDAYRASLGDDGKHPAVGKRGADVWPEIWDFIGPLIDRVMTRGEPTFFEDQLVPFYRNSQIENIYWTFSYSPAYGDQGQISGVFVTCTETTQKVNAANQLRFSEQRFQNLIRDASVGIIVLSGDELRVNIVNQTYARLIDRQVAELMGNALFTIIPETETVFRPIIDTVRRSGESVYLYDQPYFVYVGEARREGFLNLIYQPYKEPDGTTTGVIVFCQDVTEQMLARQKVEESEAKLRSFVSAVPAALVLFVGRELIVEMPSQNFIDTIDRGPDITGKSLSQLMPELESQSFLKILDEVYLTGKPFSVFGTQVDIVQQDGSVTHDFFNLVYTPLFNAQHEVYAILSIATNVTKEVTARQQLEETERSLQEAIDLAQLATWMLDVKTGTYQYSGRFMDWLGFSNSTKSLDEAYNPLPDDYRQSVADAIFAVIQPGSSGIYDNEHPIINRLTGQVRIIHAQGRTYFDGQGEPVKLIGTAQDVTEQRELQLALEQAVWERTEELAAANEEMAAINEEMAATNEELSSTNDELMTSNEERMIVNDELREANNRLTRSNDNLEKFAYVASHDLQEPLRKIQSFGDLLKSQYSAQLGDGVAYLERMQSAASRMSTLIRDLLTFSRIATQRETVAAISLSKTINSVLTDLDLRIQETKAVVTVDLLPTIQGDRAQVEQLFQNLISNALKFRRAGVPPVVRITNQLVVFQDLPPAVRPDRLTPFYHQIDVTDNGIGFDDKYVDRIFQVFQRLHGKSEFAGTGIGLAICEKVVTNHGGAITATSQPGQGATFSVYFPS